MIRTYSFFSNKKSIKDLIWIILFLVTGLAGFLILSDPIRFVAPKLPMISHEDWPSSEVTSELRITDNWTWEERREFMIRMEIKGDYGDRKAEVTQWASWYADPMEPADKAEYDIGNRGSPTATSPLSKDKPASMLFCQPDKPSCVYYAYSGHWYTKVIFRSMGDEYLSFSDIERIISHVDQLLLSMGDEP
jgi:hypothetical protein